MGHIPHLFLQRPWERTRILLSDKVRHHLENVLRRRPGSEVTYTDGRGTAGAGTFDGEGIARGTESTAAGAPPIAIAVAPPGSSKRVRFVVEKLGELGVDHLTWLDTAYGTGRPPAAEKGRAWAIAALQQSRGDRLLEIDGPMAPSGPWEQEAAVYVADPKGAPLAGSGPSPDRPCVMLIGPEGGFAPGEIPGSAVPISLGPRLLRTETAAVVAAAMLMLGR